MNKILVEVSVGELLDKISILEIKKEKIKDPEKLKFINEEYGILKDQLNKNVKSDENEWKGECFVFDYRVSLNDSLEKGEYDMCYACRMPLSKENKKNKYYLKGQSCEYCYDQTTIKQKERFNEREKQIKLSKVKNLKHLGPKD